MDKQKNYKQIKENIKKDMDNMSIPQLIKYCTILAEALFVLSTQTNKQIKKLYIQNGILPLNGSYLKGLNEYCKLIQQADFMFFNRLNNFIEKSLDDEKELCNTTDAIQKLANHFITLFLIYMDKFENNDDARKNLLTLINNTHSQGIINPKIFELFSQNRF